MEQQIDGHRKTFDPLNPRDYIDAFLIEQSRLEKLSGADKNQHYFTGIATRTFQINHNKSFINLTVKKDVYE